MGLFGIKPKYQYADLMYNLPSCKNAVGVFRSCMKLFASFMEKKTPSTSTYTSQPQSMLHNRECRMTMLVVHHFQLAREEKTAFTLNVPSM